MEKAEFDKFADEYVAMHKANIRVTGESPEFFAEYKIKDLAGALAGEACVRTILDFGGGIGNSVPYMHRYLPNTALTCLDVSDRSLAIARERYPNQAEYVSFDGARIPFEAGTFDVAFASCVFHHIEATSHAALLKELARVLRPGGWLFIFEHNPFNPLTRHAVNTCPFDENAVLISGATMRELFREAGLVDVRLRYRIFFPHFLAMLRGFERFLTWLPLGAQYYVCGQRTWSS
jgi:SAM-dependent methyltransferase